MKYLHSIRLIIPTVLFLPALSLADSSLIDVKDRGLEISCNHAANGKGAIECAVQQRNLSLIDVFQITDPARLVMDLAERPRGKSHKQQARANAMLTGVRTGWHPDKYRIVFDLNPEHQVRYTWRQNANTIYLQVEPQEASSSAQLVAPEINLVRRIDSGEELPSTDQATVATDRTDHSAVDVPESVVVAHSSVLPAEAVLTTKIDTPTDVAPDCADTEACPATELLSDGIQRSEASQAINDVNSESNEIAQAEQAEIAITNQDVAFISEPEKVTVVRPTTLSKVAVVRNRLPAPRGLTPELSERQEVKAEIVVETETESAEAAADEAPMARARMNPNMLERDDSAVEGQVLHGISFSTSSDSENPVVHLQLTEKPHFNLSKLGPRTYRLRVLRCSVTDESLTLPFFPPHTFPRVSFLQAEPSEDRTEITIGVERGTRLMAISSDTGIDIKVVG